MKSNYLFLIILPWLVCSCSTIQVTNDYDTKTDFSRYNTFAYHKNTIDKADISDLDKKRILRAIDEEMHKKGLQNNDNPDLLISFFARSNEEINVNQMGPNWGWGWGWGWGGFWGSTTTVSRATEGTLVIDILDAKTKELLWQGAGYGLLTRQTDKKEEKIREFVAKILAQYPPQPKKK